MFVAQVCASTDHKRLEARPNRKAKIAGFSKKATADSTKCRLSASKNPMPVMQSGLGVLGSSRAMPAANAQSNDHSDVKATLDEYRVELMFTAVLAARSHSRIRFIIHGNFPGRHFHDGATTPMIE